MMIFARTILLSLVAAAIGAVAVAEEKAPTFTFAVLGDPHPIYPYPTPERPPFSTLGDVLNALAPDFVIIAGYRSDAPAHSLGGSFSRSDPRLFQELVGRDTHRKTTEIDGTRNPCRIPVTTVSGKPRESRCRRRGAAAGRRGNVFWLASPV